MPIIPFKNIDVLVVQEMGKDVSGTGLDTNVIGRRMIAGEREPELPGISRIVVLDLSDNSQGNATGIGLADIITQRLYNKINFEKTLLNIISSTFIERAKIPLTMPTDKSAFQMGLMTCWKAAPLAARIMMIKNTRSLQKLFVSKNLLADARQTNNLQCSQNFSPFSFSENGNMKKLDKRESKSRPDAGLVTVRTTGRNQDGTVVCTFERTILVAKRGHSVEDRIGY